MSFHHMRSVSKSAFQVDAIYIILLSQSVCVVQVHDEVILEGPEENAERARALVVQHMGNPFGGITLKPLRVDLVVDAKYAKTWYEAK